MVNVIQEAAKQKIVELLKGYDVSYIDYDAKEDEYSIRLDKAGVFVDGVKVTDG
ncbi:hypothetical protein [Peribacillus sp. TH24]|uniref:hypothetical protein n=1 Tax=Peribacillus sp. TH24 TaxID=2798483 RepID=UPI001913E224|nr:hypothetical protein [Peribacillus sp. TH24]MBK5446055.1 hypothetical protein [Peribacillus sp. TH24]